MDGKRRFVRPSWLRTLAVALVALVLGAALGPAALSAATTAFQGVLVKNTSAQAVFVQPPAHTFVGFTAAARMRASNVSTTSVIYRVPPGKWLVITSATMAGTGLAPLARAEVWSSGSAGAHIQLPVNPALTRSVSVYQAATLPGQWVIAPNTAVMFSAYRDPSDNGDYYDAFVYVNGYLTAKP